MDCQTLKELILSSEWTEIPEIIILSVKETYNILISIQAELRAKAERNQLSAVLEDVAKIIDRRYDSSLQMTSGIQREQGLDRVQLEQVRTMIETALQRKTLKMQTGESPKAGRTDYMGSALLEQIQQIQERSLQKHGELLIQIENLRNQFGSITTNLTNQLEEQLARYEKDLEQLRHSHDQEISRQAQLIKELKRENLKRSSKVDSRGSQGEYIQSVISTLRSQVQQINVKKVQRKQMSELKSRVVQLQQEKSQSSRQYEKILHQIEESRVADNEKIKKFKSEIRSQFTKGLKDSLKTLREEIKAIASSSRQVYQPVRQPRQPKVNESMSISKKQSKSAINDIKQSLRRVQQQLSVRKEPNQSLQWVQKRLVQQDQKLQNYIKHVCQLIDQKPQGQPVSLSLLQLHQLIRLTSSNSLIAHEFVWKSVVHNTNHDNYKLQNNRQTVFVLTPGLYRISVAVFTLLPNQFHVILNNECIVSSQFTKESARRTGCVRGNQVSELVVLPSRCRLSVSYKGPEEYQSFFQLERL